MCGKTSSQAQLVVRWLSLGLIAGVALAFVLAPWPLMDKLRAVGFAMCPQRPAHSMFLAGAQLPLEARKVGIYLAFLSTITYLVILGCGRSNGSVRRPVAAVLFGFILLMGVDGFNALFYDLELPHLYRPDNNLRLATGLLSGLATAMLALPVLGVSLWPKDQPRGPVVGWRELLVALVVQAVLFVAVVSGSAWLLYPLSALSIASAVAMLLFINALFLVGVIKWPWRVVARPDLLPILALAMVLSGLELGAMAAFRLALVGTAPL
ncbi:MAG: DUF2085 domain-containing protein [Chloroflexota bacterium]